jgi:hypothetical protein
MSYVSVTGGFWIPTEKLKLLGAHPSLGCQVGYHHNVNDLALTIQFKFIEAAHPYTVLRNGRLYDLTHFFGGYIGVDYTRFIISDKSFQLGVVAGAGYDGFDISSGEGEEYLKPLSIGSLNVNTGLRFNFFYTARKFIGIQGRYNMINYKNEGGSTLTGDAITIDLIFGFNK